MRESSSSIAEQMNAQRAASDRRVEAWTWLMAALTELEKIRGTPAPLRSLQDRSEFDRQMGLMRQAAHDLHRIDETTHDYRGSGTWGHVLMSFQLAAGQLAKEHPGAFVATGFGFYIKPGHELLLSDKFIAGRTYRGRVIGIKYDEDPPDHWTAIVRLTGTENQEGKKEVEKTP